MILDVTCIQVLQGGGDLEVRICNAVPSPGHSLHLSASFIGNDRVLQYRECQEYHASRERAPFVHFKLENGVETTWPENSFDCADCHTVFLVAYRRVLSVGLSVAKFDVKAVRTPDNHPISRVFFLDAYEGGGASPSLTLNPSLATAVRGSVASIGLKPSGDVVLRPGRYEATSQGGYAGRKPQSTLIVLEGENYIVVRVGMAGRQDGLPAELLVFPKSNSKLLPSTTEDRSTAPPLSHLPFVMVVAFLIWHA